MLEFSDTCDNHTIICGPSLWNRYYETIMIRCVGNVRQGGDGRYYMTCRRLDDDFLGVFYHNVGAIEFADKWIDDNCKSPAHVYGTSTIAFDDEADASLFWFTFSKQVDQQ